MIPLILGGIAGASALGKYLTAQKYKPKRFGQTDLAAYLRKLSQEGRYSPKAMMNIMSGMGRTAGNIAQTERAGVRGWLARSGMGDSIAGASALARPGIESMRTLAGAEERLETENELSKVQAEESLAREGTNWEQMRRGYKSQTLGDLVGGLASAAATGVGAGMQQAQYQTETNMNNELARIQTLIMMGKIAEAEAALQLLLGTGMGGG